MLTRAGAAAQAKNYKARESEAGQLQAKRRKRLG